MRRSVIYMLGLLGLHAAPAVASPPLELPAQLESPNGALRLELARHGHGLQLSLAVADGINRGGEPGAGHGTNPAQPQLVSHLPLARHEIDDVGLGELREHTELYRLLHGKTSRVARRARTVRLELGERVIELRLQDDGLAFRRSSNAEPLALRVPEGSTAWLQEYVEPSHTGPSYEEPYRRLPAGTASRGRSRLARLLNPLLGTSGLQITGSDGWALPALVRTPGGHYLLLCEAGLELGHAGHHLENRGASYRFEPPPADQGLSEPDRDLPEPPFSPWRIAIAGDLATIFASTLVTDVSAPRSKAPALAGRVRPGRLAWDWWTHLETGPPARQRRHIDFAAEMGFEFVLVDANWHRWPDAEAEVRRLVAYGAAKGAGKGAEGPVDLVLWYNSGGPNNIIQEGPRDRMHRRQVRQAEFAKLALWGVAGVKVDFWHSDRAVRIASYLELLEDAAENGLMVNVHGSTVPRGWRRTYPNLMTYEAVRGAEFYRFPLMSGPTALDHVRYVLVRNVVGAMDYTPVVFEAALDDAGLPWAHSLATGVLFESAWQHLADTADDPKRGYRAAFARFPDLRDLLRRMPAAWHESVLLAGDPDHHVVLARRRGEIWWLAGIQAGDSAWRADLDLSATGCAAGRRVLLVQQAEQPDSLQFTEITVACQLAVELPARGGFVAVMEPLSPAPQTRARR